MDTNPTIHVVRESRISLWISMISLLGTTLVAFASIWPLDIIKDAKFRVTPSNSMRISQHNGRLILYQYLDINNIGNDFGSISKIEGKLTLLNSNNINDTYVASQFNASTGNTSGYSYDFKPLIKINLEKQTQLTGITMFSYNSTDAEKYKLNRLFNNYENRIQTLQLGRSQYDYKALLKQITPIENYINQKLAKYEQGTYKYTLSFTKNDEKEPFEVFVYTFYLGSEDISQLHEQKSAYMHYLKTTSVSRYRSDIFVDLILNK